MCCSSLSRSGTGSMRLRRRLSPPFNVSQLGIRSGRQRTGTASSRAAMLPGGAILPDGADPDTSLPPLQPHRASLLNKLSRRCTTSSQARRNLQHTVDRTRHGSGLNAASRRIHDRQRRAVLSSASAREAPRVKQAEGSSEAQ